MRVLLFVLISLAAGMGVPAGAQEPAETQATTAPAAEPQGQAPAKPNEAPAAKPKGRVWSYALIIRTAEDPVVAISAYARGYAVDPKDLGLHKAYLERMVKADLPGLVHESARVVLAAEPNNGLAWAVVAHMHSKRDEMAVALVAVAEAVKRLPDDAFVLKTAGGLLARYEHERARLTLPASLAGELARLKASLAEKQAFADAYTVAKAELARRPAVKAPEDDTDVAGKIEEVDELLRQLRQTSRSLDRAIDTRGSSTSSGVTYLRIYSGYPYGGYYVYPYGSYHVGRSYWPCDRGWYSGHGVRIGGTFSFLGGDLRGRFSIGSSPHRPRHSGVGRPGRGGRGGRGTGGSSGRRSPTLITPRLVGSRP